MSLEPTPVLSNSTGLDGVTDGNAWPSQGDWAAQAERRLLDAACAAVEQGARWNDALVARAAGAASLSVGDAKLLLPDGGRDLAALLWRRHDENALARLDLTPAATLKVRERIRTAVIARIDAALEERAAVQAASLFLARPDQTPLAMRLGWATADGLWRWAGDTATDANHYSKRALLWGILASTFATRLSRGEEAAHRHLDGQIARVMAFEIWKAKLPPLSDGLTVLAANLGRLRYRS